MHSNCSIVLFIILATVLGAVSPTLFSSELPVKCPSPPCVCTGGSLGHKSVVCVSDRLNQIPIDKMDPDTQVLNVTAPIGSYNAITLGRFFETLERLDELHITRSRLPAIGDYTFCPSPNSLSGCHYHDCNSTIRVLNLSDNSLQSLRPKELSCLRNLRALDLSMNHLSTLISAVFNKVHNLNKLILAHNKLADLSPLLFYGLDSLELLDLSHNLFQSIDKHVLKDVPALTKLLFNDCQIKKLDTAAFQDLKNLEYLDLSHNQLNHFNASTFIELGSLRILKLNHNHITVLPDNLFAGLRLESLDLSFNFINPLKGAPFASAAIRQLDISSNRINSFSSMILDPLSNSLERLVLDRNKMLIDPHSSLVALLHPLRRLRHLSAVGLRLNESLPESTFDIHYSLVSLNLSHNNIHELTGRLVSSLVNLRQLDVSHNQLTFVDPSALNTLSRLNHLDRLYFAGNPFSCYRCHILPFIDWLNSEDPSAYWNVCDRHSQDPAALTQCAQCDSPDSLTGRYLHEANLDKELEWCTNPEVQLRLTASEPQVGLILAFLIIVSLIAVILVVVAIYRKHGAVYYTQEDKYPSTEKIYHDTVANMTQHGRMVSLGSTQYSRQNTFTSPHSSLDGGQPVAGHSNTVTHGVTVNAPANAGVCNDCASSPQVKQMLASIPAMTEMLEQSLNAAVKNGAMLGRVAPPPSTYKPVDSVRRELSVHELSAQNQQPNETSPLQIHNPPPPPSPVVERPEPPVVNKDGSPEHPQTKPKQISQENDEISTSDVHIYI